MILAPPPAAWFHEHAPHLGVANALSASIARTDRRYPGTVPELRDKRTILIGSDYTGFHPKAQFEVTSFVVTNPERLESWDARRLMVRERLLPQARRLSYKALNDGHRRAALMPFLDITNQIPGLLVNIAVDRKLTTLFAKKDGQGCDVRRRDPLFAGWKSAAIERAIRAMHFISIFLRGLSGPGQDVVWFTDEDEIVANERRHRLLVSLMANVASHYLPHALRHLRIGTTRSDTGRRDIEDFVAIADLAGGAIQEILSDASARTLVDSPSLFLPIGSSLTRKARRILEWLADSGNPLHRLTFIVDEPMTGKPRITSLRFHRSRDATGGIAVACNGT